MARGHRHPTQFPMHFESITLVNVGSFKGVQTVNLGFSTGKDANVICGSYGSGKSTLLRAVEWVLTGDVTGPASKLFLRDTCYAGAEIGARASASVIFALGAKKYEIFCEQGDGGTGASGKNNLRLRIWRTDSQDWETLDNPESRLRALIPLEIRTALFMGEDGDFRELFQPSSLGILSMPEFRMWARSRLDRGGVAGVYGRRNGVKDRLRTLLAESGEAETIGNSTTAVMAGLQLMAFFREWIRCSEKLPEAFQHLRGESLPWLLDSPFESLDLPDQEQAVRLLLSVRDQFLIVSSPHGVGGPVEKALTPRLGALHLLRSGFYPRNGGNPKLFGQELILSREDRSDFTEIVPIEIA